LPDCFVDYQNCIIFSFFVLPVTPASLLIVVDGFMRFFEDYNSFHTILHAFQNDIQCDAEKTRIKTKCLISF